MSNDYGTQGDLSEQIALLKKWVTTADQEKNPGLVRSLVETLSRVTRDQDKRNVMNSSVLGRDALIEYAGTFSRFISQVLTEEIQDEELRWRIIDRILAELSDAPLPLNSETDKRLLLGRER